MATAARNPTAFCIVVFGGENYLLDREIDKARATERRRITMLDGEDTDELELLSILESGTTDGPQTIIFDNAQNLKLSEESPLTKWVEGKVPGDASTLLVAIVRSEKLTQGWRSLSQQPGAKSKELPKFKPWESDKIVTWVKTEAANLGVTLEQGVPETLVKTVGMDLYRLSNELRKLAIFVGNGKMIQKDHLKLVVSASPSATQFQVAEAALAKNAVQAMNLLTIMFKNNGEEATVPIVYALMKQIERAIVVRKLLDKGVSDDEIAAAVGMKPWLYKNQLLPSVNRHAFGDLVLHMRRLCKLDVDVKSTASSKRTLVELAVLEIAR
jgi:DNA polymerase-3 subunit delta